MILHAEFRGTPLPRRRSDAKHFGQFGWEIFYHYPHSHDLVACAYHFLMHKKILLTTHRLNGDEISILDISE